MLRRCLDCPTLIPKDTRGGRCRPCALEQARRRGTTTAQGLGWAHQQRRAELIPAALGTPCPDCGQPMTDPTRMVADHTTARSADPSSVADRVHCRRCSDSQGGHLGPLGRTPPPGPTG